jgi:hypothetical protein
MVGSIRRVARSGPLLLGLACGDWLRRIDDGTTRSRIVLGWVSLSVLSLDWLLSVVFALVLLPYFDVHLPDLWFQANFAIIVVATILAVALKGRSRWQAFASGFLTVLFFWTRVVK